MIRRWLAQVSGCPPQLLVQPRKLVPQSPRSPHPSILFHPLSKKKRADGSLISSKSTLAFNTQLFLEPTLSPFLSKSISTWDHGGGPLPCLSESTVHAHALFRRRPPTPAECPTPYQDPCSANPQGPTLPTVKFNPHCL